MQASAVPNPFPTATGFLVAASGGTPPYSATPLVPPSPPGTSVVPGSNPPRVMVPEDTPSGTPVKVRCSDGSPQPQSVDLMAQVA
jgi:hypothetical protein